ncbi:MAG: S49 family peptidase [Gammaproteobacteria bacterium]
MSNSENPFTVDAENKKEGWEKDVVTELAFSAIKEQRRTRRWGIFFKLLMFAYLLGILFLYRPGGFSDGSKTDEDHTAVIDLKGIISADDEASADTIITGLREAYENEHVKGVILRINSPGGSPVQSAYINDEMHKLREEHPDIPLYAVVTDMCASGGYFIAVAAEKIYADKSSVVGSIGVRMDGFGFVDAMNKLGVERRLLTAGEHKGFLDPFMPTKEDDVEHVKGLLASIHEQFIDNVRAGRGDRLHETPTMFSGLIWTGEQAKELGLIDDFGTSSYVAKEIFGAEELVDYTPAADLFEKFSKRFGVALGQGIGKVLSQQSIQLK